MVAVRRQMIAFSIAQNPTTITINRTTKTRSGGGFKEEKFQAGTFVVRIFQAKDSDLSDLKEISQMPGTKQKAADFGLLADYQADIQDGPNARDEFDVDGLGHFVVQKVNPQIAQGEIVGYQVALERVK